MPPQEPKDQTPVHPPPDRVTEFLEILRTAGPAALDHHRYPAIKNIALRKLHLDWNTPHHYTITIASDDLLKDLQSLDPALDPLAAASTVCAATLEFALVGTDLPHFVQVGPSQTLHFQYQQDAACVINWMNDCCSKFAQTATILFLAAAIAVAPGFGDGDYDEDDVDTDRQALSY